ncbi:hypothetical protein [Niallia sp. 03133]|uniref:hypothetical protein n=1 Tax=Niallia sp. 03133 TaxID=3458060 RepID=UPI004044329C
MLCKLLELLHLILGIGGIYGGISLIIKPNGDLLHLPLSLLSQSPFSNFIIPGIILLTLFGISPIIISCALFFKWNGTSISILSIFSDKHWSWNFSLYIGFALIIWINIQVYLMKSFSNIQLIYFFLGIVILLITLLPSVQTNYKRTKPV